MKLTLRELLNTRLVVVTATTIIVLGICYMGYYRHCISSAEKNAAIRAIYCIDSISDNDPHKLDVEINHLIAEAHIAARTKKDKGLANRLDDYFFWSSEGHSFIDSGTDSKQLSTTASEIDSLDRNNPLRQMLIDSLRTQQQFREKNQTWGHDDLKRASEIRGELMKELE
jgi:hypothetical protein